MGTAQVKTKSSNLSSLLDPPKIKIYLDVDVNKQIPIILLQLTNWSFAQIRNSLQIFQRISQSPMIDAFLFHKMIPLSRKNCDLMFAKLSKGKKYISVYELIGILILTSYQAYAKKFQFLQLLFDFSQDGRITGREFMLIYYSILFGYCRLSDQKLPKFTTAEAFGQATFFPGDQQSQIQYRQITLRKCIEQYQANQHINLLFNRYDHPQIKQIKDDFVIFTKSQMKKYTKNQVDKIYRIIDNIYRKNDYGQMHMIEQNKQLRRQIRKDSCNHKIMQQKQDIMKSNVYQYSYESPKKLKKPEQKKSYSVAKLSSFTPKNNNDSLKSFRLKKLESTDPRLQKSSSIRKSMIFLDGKTYNKRQIFQSIDYFKTLADNDDYVNIKQFFEKFGKKAFLKKQVSSLFKYLDYRKSGVITIKDYFKSLYPGVRQDEIKLLIKWFQLYKEIYEADSLQINKVKVVEMTDARILPPNTIDRMREIFSALDNGNKGYLNSQDLRKSYKRGFTADELEQLMVKYGKQERIYLGGLCKMLLPIDWKIQGIQLDQIDQPNQNSYLL